MTTANDPRRAAVGIPIVPTDGAMPGEDFPLIGFVADASPMQAGFDDGGLSPHLADLFDIGVYAAGVTGRRAVSGLGYKPYPWMRPTWWDDDRRWPRVWAANFNSDKASPLEPDACHSADLGLALVMALSLTHRGAAVGTVIATGMLGATDKAGHDTPVLPVTHLDIKLALILREIGKDASGWRGPGILFVPLETDDGELVTTAHGPALAAIAAHGFTVCPVDGLRAAVTRLGAVRTPPEPWQVWSVRAAAAAVALLVTWTVVGVGNDLIARQDARPLALTAAADPDTGASTPLRARRVADDRYLVLPHCPQGHERREGVRAGEHLVLRIDTGGEDPAGLHYMLIGVFGQSDPKLYPDALLKASVDGALDYAIAVKEPAEPGLVAVLARRDAAFDGNRLLAEVRAAMAGLDPTGRLNAAENYLRGLAPGYFAVAVETLKAGDPNCAEG